MSDPARSLVGGAFRHILYLEFETIYESGPWHDFVFDPLRMLIAEGIIESTPLDEHHSHIHVTIYKLTGPDAEDADYVSEVTRRGALTSEMFKKTVVAEGTRSAWHLGTTVVNHEQPLNPRIGMATVFM